MLLVELITILAVIQFLCFGMLTGRARARSGLKAPAVTGNLEFEQMYRVQMNTLELLVPLIPSLFLAAKYWPSALVAGLGAIYLAGRIFFWRAYVTDPSKRAVGFVLSLLPIVILVVLAVSGIAIASFKL